MLQPERRRRRSWISPFFVLPEDFERDLDRLWREGPLETEPGSSYPVDMYEEKDAIIVEAEIPGFIKDEIDVSVHNDVLRIKAERKKAEGRTREYLTERQFTRLDRKIGLPESVDATKAEAKLEEGVLHLKLPKKDKKEPRNIEIL
ncbi:MAG: Hsp20/alpha crystallin family protein [Calditrichaeota bacterium]|nr:Hsp20/alpha crystallin family protein [Calditrichota bacterium]